MEKTPIPESTVPPAYTPYPAGAVYPPTSGGTNYPPSSGGTNYPPTSAGTNYPPPAGAAYSQPQPAGGQTVIITPTGNCPNCHAGFLVETFSLCGILWLILCFPCGLICFLTMKDKKCGTCGYEVHN